MSTAGPIGDEFDPQPVVESVERYSGLRWSIRTDHVTLPHGETVVRDLQVHPGAVGILAIDDDDRVLMVRQYRHPVGEWLWEPPAGLMDIAGEDALSTAQRELVEEAGLEADHWHVLADWYNSPGGSTEGFRCFLARGLHEAPGGRPPGTGEETDLPAAWVPLDEAVSLVLAGRLANPTSVAGAGGSRRPTLELEGLRPGDAPWPMRQNLLDSGRVWLPLSGYPAP